MIRYRHLLSTPLLVSTLAAQSAVSPRPAVLRGLDHAFATSPNPEPLYRFFRDSLGWPEVYPFRNYGDFTSGVVSAGNMLWEVVTWTVPAGDTLPTELKGLAFEPNDRIPETLARLDAAGFPFQKPDSVLFTDSTGTRRLAYVNIPLDGSSNLPPAGASIFVNDNLGSTNAVARRRAGAATLAERRGGLLGILSVQEIVIGVDDVDAALARWQPLLGDSADRASNPIHWAIGPALRFVPAARPAILEMVLRVRSLPEATRALEARGWAHREGASLFLAPGVVDGLRIRLVGP